MCSMVAAAWKLPGGALNTTKKHRKNISKEKTVHLCQVFYVKVLTNHLQLDCMSKRLAPKRVLGHIRESETEACWKCPGHTHVTDFLYRLLHSIDR